MYDRLADLPLTVEDVSFERHEAATSGDFTRVSTVFALAGDGETGRGEDVTYDAEDHDSLHADPPSLPTGEYTLETYSAALDDVELFPEGPKRPTSRHYRRWAAESAMLDLALRQAETSLADALGRSYDPVRFVVSMGLGETPTADPVRRWLDVDPELEFKLDPTSAWDEPLVSELAALDRVRTLDFKAHYEDADVRQEPDPDLYRMIAEGFPDAVLEDPAWTDETRPALAGAEERLSWDKPIESLADVHDLPFEPTWLNVKPSRFGTVASLLETVDYCLDEGIRLYGGGQFELAVGRQHVQALASLFYPDAPNDVAPSGYNVAEPEPDLPSSPLDPPSDPRGLAWE
ncbi:hypothetical protein VB773_05850 [Haloarculaceae archaeon H-GB2-1]|nr:hypothetical protein [Haloarculaceae archaeon H-GB1-1]MEA5389088.1 hypothetical protein [Haloarculaceae archaeon H-GB11]MEA5407150.1 hypothetical protein [Haloarculaceae archaeon H-GB2-1]